MQPFWTGGRGARRIVPALCALALAVVAAGCTDEAVAPQAAETPEIATVADVAPTFHRSRGGAHVYRNRDRYRHRHRRGCRHERHHDRAEIDASALLGANGLTRLTVTTGDLDFPNDAPGTILKLQVKIYDNAGRYLGVRNFQRLGQNGGTVELNLAGLQRGWTLKIMGHVRVDGRRVDVVDVTERVKGGAQLSATLNLPPQVTIGVPTIITATVWETGGDTGGTADCVLVVGGVVVDRARDIFVDAGDNVTCAFTYTFGSAGPQDVEVQLVSSTPSGGQGCESGNCGSVDVVVATDEGAVDVISPNVTSWAASADDRWQVKTSTFDSSWRNLLTGATRNYEDFASTAERRQTVNVQGTLSRPASWPLSSVTVSYGPGGAWLTDSWSNVTFDRDSAGVRCVSRQRETQAAIFVLCSGATTSTYGYTFFAGTVTYRSQGFARTFDGVNTEGDTYSWNDEYTVYNGGEQARPWNGSVSLSIRVTDGQGTFQVNPVVPLTAYDVLNTLVPRTCVVTLPYWLEGGSLSECTQSTQREYGMSGSATG